MIETFRYVVFKPPQNFIITLIWVVFSFGSILAQTAAEIGTINLPVSQNIERLYKYDPATDRYIFSEEIGGYPISIPLVLTVKQYESLVLKEQMQLYFQSKVQALSGYGSNLEDAQKNLLPELYVNNKFFKNIFGSNTIDISPQGSIGIDLGYRYQRNNNPIASVINRRSPGFDFDQRISLSLLGNIGERLQITANYDTESTFDFQNLVKIQFNPPKLSQISNIIPGKVGSSINQLQKNVKQIKNKANELRQKVNEVKDKVNQAKSTLNEARQKIESLRDNIKQLPNSSELVGNRVADYLKGKVTEDAILQNIDIGNVSMPINSCLLYTSPSPRA